MLISKVGYSIIYDFFRLRLFSFHFIHLFSHRVKQLLQSNQEIGENGLQGSLQRLYETYNSTMCQFDNTVGWLLYVTIS